ncbi:MAG: DUF4377 domain-containing protein [Actinomycetota bacterium]
MSTPKPRRLWVLGLVIVTALSSGCGTAVEAGIETGRPETGTTESPRGVVRVEVAPDFVLAHGGETGVQPHASLRVIETGYELKIWPDEIEGIFLEEGTTYVLDIEITEREEYIADASSLRLRLVEVIEVSEG